MGLLQLRIGRCLGLVTAIYYLGLVRGVENGSRVLLEQWLNTGPESKIPRFVGMLAKNSCAATGHGKTASKRATTPGGSCARVRDNRRAACIEAVSSSQIAGFRES